MHTDILSMAGGLHYDYIPQICRPIKRGGEGSIDGTLTIKIGRPDVRSPKQVEQAWQTTYGLRAQKVKTEDLQSKMANKTVRITKLQNQFWVPASMN